MDGLGCIILFRPPRPFVDGRPTCEVCLQEMENLPQVIWLFLAEPNPFTSTHAWADMRSSDPFFMAHRQIIRIAPQPEMPALHRPHLSGMFNPLTCGLQEMTGNNVLSVAGLDAPCHFPGEIHMTVNYQFPFRRDMRSTLPDSLRNIGTIADPFISLAVRSR